MLVSKLCQVWGGDIVSTASENNQDNNWFQEEFKNLGINCGRTIKRFIRTMGTLSKKINESIAAASENKAEAKAIYRLAANKKVTEEVILNTHRKKTIERMKESKKTVLLNIQDTTSLCYTNHIKTKGLGRYCSEKNARGLIVHSAMVTTTEGIALGLLDQSIWTRDPADHGKSKDKNKLPIEKKESNKWLECMDRSSKGIPENIQLVHVCDREADVFEFFYKAIAEDQHFLVRVVQNRSTDEEYKLMEKVNNEEAAGEIVVEIPRDTRRNIKKRQATLEIKYTKVTVLVPPKLQKKFGKDGNVTFYIILAKEINTPEGMEPIEWYLATNLDITQVDEAMEKVNWYVQRWKIERFHYILKEGCEVEELQERDAERLEKLILMYSIISIRILCITYYARQSPDAPCDEILETQEWKVLYCIANKTAQLPLNVPTMKEAVSYIAKLGGFLGRKGDGNPGAKVIWKGLKELNIVLSHYAYLTP